MDDIKRHGPPYSFQEDAFEKNHGIIRNQIFLQNQKARSRDTSIQFARHYIAAHVVTGGLFEVNQKWYFDNNFCCKKMDEPLYTINYQHLHKKR